MSGGLKIARGLELPVDVAGESTAILAKKGAGKSNTAKVIVEEVLDHGGIQVVVFDPIGHWWSLRAGADGKPRGGYPVAVFGGMHGDLPLEETAGRLLAQTAVESGQSIVLDVSGLDSNGAMQRFVYEFLEELYKLKQAAPTPLLLVLEEADEFAPQDPKGPNVPRMVGAAARISKRGRGRGIGMLYVTQRSAALNKNVLDQADTLIVMRTIGPRDRAAIEGWVKHQDAAGMDQVLPSLPGLATGEAWIWNPERDLLVRVKVRKARTFDSSATPKAGEAAIVANVKPIDVDKLGEAIKATVERAKENDPAELRKRVRDLERALAGAQQAGVLIKDDDGEAISELEKRVDELEQQLARADAIATELDEERAAAIVWWESAHLKVLGGLLDQLHALNEDGITKMSELRAQADAAAEQREKERDVKAARAQAKAAGPRTERPVQRVREHPAVAARRDPPPALPAQPGRDVGRVLGEPEAASELSGGAALAVLAALAQFPNGRTKRQLAGLTGYRATGSTMRGALAQLRKLGYCTPANVAPIQATPAGVDAVSHVDPVPTGPELYLFWMGKLGGASRAVLELLYEAHPQGVNREDIAGHTGYELGGSTLRGALAELRKFDLATPAGVEPVRASDTLFDI